jgi:apolipoprotein D and lipocalin family protein
MRPRFALPAACVVLAFLGGCVSPRTADMPPLRALERPVDLPRFMGDWYVISHLPVFLEAKAHNAVESYRVDDDGSIATTYVFNQGAPDGPLKTYRPRGFVRNPGVNTEWGMRFIWPFKAPYLIAYLDETYETTIIGVPDRRYVWVMARTPTLDPARREAVDTALRALRQVPHGR